MRVGVRKRGKGGKSERGREGVREEEGGREGWRKVGKKEKEEKEGGKNREKKKKEREEGWEVGVGREYVFHRNKI